jgi:hypothetical protein
MKYDLSALKDHNLSMTANGQFYDKSIDGVIPSLMRELYFSRKADKKTSQEAKAAAQKEKDPAKKKALLAKSKIYDVKQMVSKILLNSGYGAIANKHFRYFRRENAEAITASGQLSIKWIAKALNKYLNTILKTDDVDRVAAIDTDSVVGNSIIRINNGEKSTIEAFFDLSEGDIEYRGDNNMIKHVADYGYTCLSYSLDGGGEYKKVNYIMAHEVEKEMYLVEVGCKKVEVTEDHSIIVFRDGKLVGTTVKDITQDDEIYHIC